MNVLILSDYDRLAADMNAKLRLHGFNSVLLTPKQGETDAGTINVSLFKSRRLITLLDHARAFVYRKLLLQAKGLYYQDVSENGSYYSVERIRKRTPFVPDVVVILFDYRMVTGRTISDVHRWSKAKIVWLMVDMKPLTGGCAYSGKCRKYTIDCGQCPLIGNRLLGNYAQATLRRRKELLKDVDLRIVAGSTYQQEQARASYLFRERRIDRMFLPTDENVFNANGRSRAREVLKLPLAKGVILFGAQRFDSGRKGYKFLLAALLLLKEAAPRTDLVLLTVGSGMLPESIEQAFLVRKLGWVDYETLSLAYQAADVFVCPSVEDSGPIMVNQSLMCGTPVVAFKMGVSLDLVEDGKTGFLAELEDSGSLARGIQQILAMSAEEKDRVTKECLKVAARLGYQHFLENFRALCKGIDPQHKEIACP